jgi:chromosome segregation ATPase
MATMDSLKIVDELRSRHRRLKDSHRITTSMLSTALKTIEDLEQQMQISKAVNSTTKQTKTTYEVIFGNVKYGEEDKSYSRPVVSDQLGVSNITVERNVPRHMEESRPNLSVNPASFASDSRLRAENDSLKSQVQEKERKIARLEDDLNYEKNKQKRQLDDKDKMIEELKGDLRKAQDDLKKIQDSQNGASDRIILRPIEAVSSTSRIYPESARSYDKERELLEKENKELTNQLEQARKERLNRSPDTSRLLSPISGRLVRNIDPFKLDRLKELEEENMETKIELENLKDNLKELIQNSCSNFENKIKALKEQLAQDQSNRQKQLIQQEARSKKELMKVSLNTMVLKDITILGKPRAKLSSRKDDSSPSRSEIDKENTGNLNNSKHSMKDYLSGGLISGHLSERSKHGDNVLRERTNNSIRSHANRDHLEAELEKLREDLAVRDQEIEELNQMLLEQNEELKQTFRSQADSFQRYGEDDEENFSDLSIGSEDVANANPKKLLKMVRALKLEEHTLTQNIVQLRSQTENLEEEKKSLEEQYNILQKELEELKSKLTKKSRGYSTPNKKEKEKSENLKKKSGEIIESDGEEDFSYYLVLKRKFDEIQAFITRIAGLLSKSVQLSRGYHASTDLKSVYQKTARDNISNISGWLQASPSKTQVDKDSRRFYLKFKKRFDASILYLT